MNVRSTITVGLVTTVDDIAGQLRHLRPGETLSVVYGSGAYNVRLAEEAAALIRAAANQLGITVKVRKKGGYVEATR